MRYLVRRVLRKSASGQVHQDSDYDTENLSIGRAAGQQVFLADMQVALQHAVIKPFGKARFGLQAVGANQLRVNNRITQSSTLGIGDQIDIGHIRLSVTEPPEGYDFAIEILPATETTGKALDGVGALSLRATGASVRPWAWLSFLLILGLSLGIPLYFGISTMHIHARSGARAGSPAPTNVMQAVMSGADHTPNNQAWSPGPLTDAHRFIANDCARCHTSSFMPVTNNACLSCHVNLPAHADSSPALSEVDFKEARCTSCHQEHHGNNALIISASSSCTDCHSDPHSRMPGSKLPAVTDFADHHPQFRVALLILGDDWHFTTRNVSLDEANPKRNPGLKFPHDKHLLPEGVKRSDGSVEKLTCSSCHISDAGGVGFLRQSFEQQCERCHKLSFEPTDPGARLPHGNVQEVWSFLRGYYSRLALGGGVILKDAPAVVSQYHRPSQVLAPDKQRAALAWADDKASSVAKEVFAYRLCITCHEIRKVANPTPLWQVAPVMQQTSWFPAARFRHGAHSKLGCDSCHTVRFSKTNQDVLMPGIAKCRQCHAGGDKSASGMAVSSSCVSCHGFHKALRHGMNGALLPADFMVQNLESPQH
ncbi:MAG: cytochrome c3 family protein [Gammaproteobacteria bacterium]